MPGKHEWSVRAVFALHHVVHLVAPEHRVEDLAEASQCHVIVGRTRSRLLGIGVHRTYSRVGIGHVVYKVAVEEVIESALTHVDGTTAATKHLRRHIAGCGEVSQAADLSRFRAVVLVARLIVGEDGVEGREVVGGVNGTSLSGIRNSVAASLVVHVLVLARLGDVVLEARAVYIERAVHCYGSAESGMVVLKLALVDDDRHVAVRDGVAHLGMHELNAGAGAFVVIVAIAVAVGKEATAVLIIQFLLVVDRTGNVLAGVATGDGQAV